MDSRFNATWELRGLTGDIIETNETLTGK